ncbi:MAG: chromate transporter [Bacteroidetes bacterium]|nr:MAG: chromate transporter [Bacteroidota bacterium]
MKKDKPKIKLTFFNLVMSFFKIGLTAYGMAILQQIKALLINNKWLTRKEVDEGIAMVQIYPGPIMFNLGTYCSYKLKGFWGSLLSAFFFLLPSYLLMLVLSWVYFNYGSVEWVKPVFLALEAMVVGIVFHVFLDFGKKYITNSKAATIGAVSFLLLLFHINALLIILTAVILEFIANIFLKEETKTDEKSEETEFAKEIPGKLSKRLTAIIITGIIFIAFFLIGIFVHTKNGILLFSMFKIGAVAFGSGFTIMPLLQQEAVITHHWLTMQQFADGIAFGQITPGPFLITSTFIGYKISGLWGSIIATFGMFFPSFFYTLVVAEIYNKVKKNKWIQRAIKGVMGAFTGMLAWVLLSLGEISLKTPSLFIWAVGSFVLVRYFKLNILWIFLIGISAELIVYFVN